MIKEDNLEFSFSGLKSAFINLHHNAEQKGESLSTEDLCASFQAAVMDILMAKTKKALEKYPVKTLVVAGGVAANKGLRERLAAEITDVKVIIPSATLRRQCRYDCLCQRQRVEQRKLRRLGPQCQTKSCL